MYKKKSKIKKMCLIEKWNKEEKEVLIEVWADQLKKGKKEMEEMTKVKILIMFWKHLTKKKSQKILLIDKYK